MDKLLLSAFIVGVCLIPGLTSYQKDPSLDSGIGDPANLHETDALRGSGSGPTTKARIEIDEAHPTFPYTSEFSEDLKNSRIITRKYDHHKHYYSAYYSNGSNLWVNLDNDPNAKDREHALLSDPHRRAATLRLPFEFPFYGHIVTNVTLANRGFLYLGEQVHAWLAPTQYIAPLMANFDSRFPNASVRYLSNDEFFTVEWHEVRLQDAPNRGAFTFQTTIHKNGSIVFAYKIIPFPVQEINDTRHPVKIGLSDAYISDRTILVVKQKTIYEFRRIDLTQFKITNGTAIIFTSLPSCLSYRTCEECVTHDSSFECEWCPGVNRCSDGTDRHRWITKSCETSSFIVREACFTPTVSPSPHV